jgi:serine/threonine-protein kinase
MARPTLGFAQESKDLVTAEVLYDEGLRLMREGRFDQACPKLEKSLSIDAGIGVTLWLADCYEKSGRLATAWSTFRQAAWLAQRDNDPRVAVAQGKAAQLEARLPRLTVKTSAVASLPGLRVERDGSEVSQEAWGIPVPLDPGRHELVAKAIGRKPWRTVVEAQAGKVVSVAIPMLEEMQSAEAESTRKGAGDPRSVPGADDANGDAWQRTVGYGLIGLGVASMGVGAYFGLRAKSKLDESKEGCTANVCNGEGGALRTEATDAANRSTLLFAVGAAVAVGGGIAIVLAPSQREAAVQVGVGGAPGFGGVVAKGRF